jgi:Zn-dependent M16 (insulinase) family peptidase
LLLTLEPKPGLDKDRNAKVEEDLKNYKTSLTEDVINALIKDTKELIAFQKREDSPESLATIPLLDIKDINPKASYYTVNETKVEGLPLIHHEEFTNKVVYTNLYFDLRVLPQDLIPYASLLSNVIGIMNTEKFTYAELNRFQNNNTGGLYTYTTSYLENQDDSKLIPKFVVTSKAMNSKLDKLFELCNEITFKTKYDDKERLKSILIKHQSQLDANIKSDGRFVANNRILSYYNNQGVFDQLTNGMDYYWFVTDLVTNYDKNADQIISNLVKVSKLIFAKENLITSVTSDKNDLKLFTNEFANFVKTLPSNKQPFNSWQLKVETKNEGFLSSSKVQYVVEGYNIKKLGYTWSGKMLVLNRIISRDWLYNRIRVVGGAYGGNSFISSDGNIRFASYRDPNLKETLENYKKAVDIGSISDLDQPLTLSAKGNRAFNYYFSKIKPEDVQKERDEVLSTKKEDIKGYAKMIQDIIDKGAYCVYGNSEKIDASKDIFKSLIKIDK